MATKKSATPKPIAEIEQGPSKFEQFLDANQRKLIALAVIAIIGVLGYTAWRTIEKDNRLEAGALLVGAGANELTGSRVGATELSDVDYLFADKKEMPGGVVIVKDVKFTNTPSYGSAHLLVADAQWTDGRQDAAIATLREFIDQNPSHPARPTALASLGSRLMAQGKTGEARDIFNTLLEDPDSSFLAPYALISLGDIARAEGKIDEAEAFLNRARDEYPDDNFSSIATQHLALLRSADPVEIEPPPPPVPEPPPSITKPDDEPDVSKPIELDPTKMPGAGDDNPLIPGTETTLDPDAPGFNPTPPTPPPVPAMKPDEAPDASAPEKPAPAKPETAEPEATGGNKQAEPAGETGTATDTEDPEKPESDGDE